MKKVLINVEERELRVAILEDEQLVELYIESLDEKSILNNIYKGRVEDVLPGLKAAFVNVGLERNAFLHFDDVRPDLLWAKYREMNPDMADEVPTAREALASVVEADTEADADTEDGRRKRRRGRRGGKKRRPDAEDTYSPGLPVGVTEDDLEYDDDDESDSIVQVARPIERVVAPEQEEVEGEVVSVAPSVAPDEVSQPATVAPGHGFRELSPEEIEARKLARLEKQKQRRDRWEQKKLERQQRRHQERADRLANQQAGGAEPGNDAIQAPVAQYVPPAPVPEPEPPPAHGTRAAASAYDFSGNYVAPNRRQLQQFKARYGDNFGNIAVPTTRRNDSRDSQVDFFGTATPPTEEEYSIWDERQPNLGPVPGAGKAFLPDMEPRRTRRPDGQSKDRRTAPGGQQQNRPKKFGPGNKRRGGKKRSMRKRDNRSFFAFSADDIENDKPLTNEAVAEESEAPKKRTTRKKTATTAGDATEKKTTATRKTAAKKPTTRKKKVSEVDTPELPLDMAAEGQVAEPVSDEKPAAKKTTRAKTASTRTRKAPVKKTAPADELELDTPTTSESADEAPVAATVSIDKAEVTSPTAPAVPVSAEAVRETELGSTSPSVPDSAIAEAVSPQITAPTADASQPAVPSEASSETERSGSTLEQAEDSRRRRGRTSRAERAARHRARRAESKAANGSIAAAETEAPVAEAPVADTQIVEVPAVPAQAVQPPSIQKETVEQDRAPAPAAPSYVPAPRQNQAQQQAQRRDQRKKLRRPQFQEVFKKGDEIMVQVVKEEIGLKGARISSYVSLPGRYLVLLPYPNQEGGISRKVEDIRERKRLKTLLRDISSDETAFIVRTAGVFQEEKEIRDDVEFLSHEWRTIADRFAKVEPTSLVYDDHDIIYRLARDVFDDSVAEIHIDSHTEHDKLKQILGKLIPDLVDKVKLYSGAENIFHKFGVTKQIQKAARRKVWLKSGGYLIIDEAEALTAIDVNTGKSVGKDDQEKLILRTNIEAARAVARELKLRDIGGLIVIDFIDMKDTRNKDQVLNELKLQLRKDRSKTSVSAISEFGLVEMTRKRVRRSLRKTLFMDCPYCQGAGVVLNEQQIWLHIKHEVVRQLESTKPAPTLSITVNPRIRAYIDQNYREVIRRLEQKYDTEIRFSMSDIFHIENYQIEAAETSGVISGSATMPTR